MIVKKFKNREEALVAVKKAVERKQTLKEYLKNGCSVEELERMGFKIVRFA